MARRAAPLGLSLLVVLSGCLSATEGTQLIPSSLFGGTGTAARFTPDGQAPPATAEAAGNIARVGIKLVNENPSIGLRPVFKTIGGDAKPELFHRGDSEVLITESLARQCKTEGELAALLGTELGRMVAERAGKGVPDVADRGPPPAVSVGNEYGGSFGPADGTRMMELAKYERKRALARQQAAPDPDVLARAYLEKAGYNPADVDAVAPLVRKTEGKGQLEVLMGMSVFK